MTLSANAQAILLLTAHFTKVRSGDAVPLTPKEWGTFALWLKDCALTPESLLVGDPVEKLSTWSDKKITQERLISLLNRGSAMALAVEKWLRAGLWIMTRSDADYPKRLKLHLKNDSPPVLFGCGNRNLLNQGGIAVIGSRSASSDDLAFTKALGAKAASSGFSIVSGGAKGVDETAMLGALKAEGTAIGVLADSLLRTASSAQYRPYLLHNNLVLISPFYPEAGFNVGNAMQRNRYIYCLADAAIAVHSGKTGGTWNGVLENLKKTWTPMWVKRTEDPQAGNAELAAKGAQWLPENLQELELETLREQFPSALVEGYNIANDLFNQQEHCVQESVELQPVKPSPASEPVNESAVKSFANRELNQFSFYQLFLRKVETLCRNQPKTSDELKESLDLNKTQLDIWLKQAVEEDKLEKLNRPVRYQWQEIQQKSLL